MFPLTALMEVGGKLSLQGLFGCFPSSQPKINCVIRQSCFFAPFSYRQGFAKSSDKSSVSSIFRLLFSGGPSAIFRVITFLVVNALYTKAIWSFTHVAQKIGKVKPSIANCDTPASVIFVRFASLTCASFFNPLPYLVSRSALSAQSVSM